jgi:uncharacterized membrane protein YkvA (DUF1232 family)
MWTRLRRVIALLRDPRTPTLPRAAVILAILYFLSPIDLVPDFAIPVAGYLDDLVLIWMTFRWLLGSGEKAARAGASGPPQRRA